MPNPAAVLYEAYRKAMGLSASWAELTPQEEVAWWAVVRAYATLFDGRSANYAQLSPEEQWDEDRRLGLLDL